MDQTRRSSKKRQAIYDELCSTKSHPSAEMLYSRLKPEIPDLSLGTVYRNLGVLMSDGVIVSVGRVNGEERYDCNTAPHPHFVCSRCGRVFDLELAFDLCSLLPEVEKSTGGRVISGSLCFYGVCKSCE